MLISIIFSVGAVLFILAPILVFSYARWLAKNELEEQKENRKKLAFQTFGSIIREISLGRRISETDADLPHSLEKEGFLPEDFGVTREELQTLADYSFFCGFKKRNDIFLDRGGCSRIMTEVKGLSELPDFTPD